MDPVSSEHNKHWWCFTFGQEDHLLLFTQSCPTLCDPTDCSTPGFPFLHHLQELAQTHVHWVSDAIQSSHHPLLLLPSIFSSIRVFSRESVLTSGVQNIGVSASASVLPINILGWLPLGLPGMISFNLRDSQEYSPHHSWKASIKCYISP